MLAISVQELKNLLKSLKSIILVLIIFGASYYLAKLIQSFNGQMKFGLGDDSYAVGIVLIIFVFGFLFITSLSHDSVNREISTRTMRFLVTKTSRSRIIYGKFIGIWLFWFLCIFISYTLIAFVSKKFLWLGIYDCMAFITVGISINLLFSVLLSKPAASMFFSIIFSLVFPAASFAAVYSSYPWIYWFKYLTPLYYSSLGSFFIMINYLYGIGVLYLTVHLFKRRDL